MCILSLTVVIGLSINAFAAQFDAPYYELQKKHAGRWAKEDKAMREEQENSDE